MQLSRDVTSGENSVDVVINVQLGSVHLSFVLTMCCAREETGIASQMLQEVGVRGRGDFSFRRVHQRTMQS